MHSLHRARWTDTPLLKDSMDPELLRNAASLVACELLQAPLTLLQEDDIPVASSCESHRWSLAAA